MRSFEDTGQQAVLKDDNSEIQDDQNRAAAERIDGNQAPEYDHNSERAAGTAERG